ncbi:MAG: GNAT family N-acetyltransferase [Candidatus Thorarchaeota archaeon]|jgi:RimJ/RimL family protein N-acetyltransferase
MYEGEIVKLRRLEVNDAEIILKYWNDYQLRQYFPNPLPRTLGEIQDFISSRNQGFAGKYVFTFGIEDKATGKLVGFIDLSNINWISRTGMIDNIVIFDVNNRGKGYGKDATLLLLDFGFNIIGLHNVSLFVYAFNKHAISFYEKIGFQRVGALREAAFIDGKRDDSVIMDIIKTDFIQRYGVLPKS